MNAKKYVGSPGYELLVGNLYTLDVNNCEYTNPNFIINIKKMISIKDESTCTYCDGNEDVICSHCIDGNRYTNVLFNVSLTINPEYYIMNSGKSYMFNLVNHIVHENSHPNLIHVKVKRGLGLEIIVELVNKTTLSSEYFTQDDINNGSVTIINYDENNLIKYNLIKKMFYLKSKEVSKKTKCDCNSKYKSIEGVVCKKCNNTGMFGQIIYVPDFTVYEYDGVVDFLINNKGIKFTNDVNVKDVKEIVLTCRSSRFYYTSEELANEMSKKYKEYYDNSYHYKIICDKCVVKWDCDGYEYIGRGQTSYTNIENKMNYTDTVDSMNFTMQVDLSEAYVFYLSNEIDPTEKIILEHHLYQGDLEVESYNYTFTYGELYNSNDSDAISILKDECELKVNAIINNRVTELIKTKGILNETNN